MSGDTGIDYRAAIGFTFDDMKKFLLEKNDAYGNSALDPVRIMSKASPREQILVRIDDKLSRWVRGKNTDKVPEDVMKDLAGYFMLYQVLERVESEQKD